MRRRRSHSNRGKDLENAIDVVHYRYRIAGLAYPIRNHPEIRIQGRTSDGRITGYLKAQGEPDYLVIGAPRVLVFDAKRCQTPAFRLQNIHAHQAGALTAANHCGAFSFLLIQNVNGRYVVPWKDIEAKYHRWQRKDYRRGTGATQLSADELTRLSIVSFSPNQAPDYFSALCTYLSG